MAYLSSENVKMYPSAYRDSSKSNDSFAQLNTEFNLTHTKLLSQYDENNNYSYEDENYLIIYLHGYYFSILQTDITSIPHDTNNSLYAVIKLADFVQTKVLVNYGTTSSTTLDNLKSGSSTDYEFQGLCITDEEPDTTNEEPGIETYYIKVADYKAASGSTPAHWEISCQPLKLSTTEIRDGSGDVAITESLTSDNIFTNNIDASEYIQNNNQNNNDSWGTINLCTPISTSDSKHLYINGNDKTYIDAIDELNTTFLCTTILTSRHDYGKEDIFENKPTASITISVGEESSGSGIYNIMDLTPSYIDSTQGKSKVNLGEELKKLNSVWSNYYNGAEITNIAFNGVEIRNSQVNGVDISSGNINTSGTITASTFTSTSDVRLKENIKDYICEKSILDLPIKEFNYKDSKQHTIGCIAQDLKEICPEIVHENEEGFLTIEENKLVYLLIQEVKKLKEEIEKLK